MLFSSTIRAKDNVNFVRIQNLPTLLSAKHCNLHEMSWVCAGDALDWMQHIFIVKFSSCEMFYALKLIGFVVGLEIASYEVTFLLSSDLIELITSQQFCTR